ncbi:MAG: lysophospholipid acyltransferase family protein [Acidobacteriia bacterium]|nr:lysophospholipid acyltransferase family protein [Terriglobia bacterium]
MRARHHVEYAAVLALSALLRALPRTLALVVGAALGQLGWWIRLRREVVLANLGQALPELDVPAHRRIAARAARNFGRTVAEFVRFAGSDRARVTDFVTLSGTETLRTAMADGGGAIVVTAHVGAWALYVTALAAAGIPCALLVGRQHNPKVQRFILGIPGDAVRFVAKSKGAPREILHCLREGRAIVMVADHRAGRTGVLAPFLGRVASTLPLPGTIAARYGTPTLVMSGHRLPDSRHLVAISRLALPDLQGDEEAYRTAVTAAINDALGKVIRACPEQYFWYHRRWHGVPEGSVTTAAHAPGIQSR